MANPIEEKQTNHPIKIHVADGFIKEPFNDELAGDRYEVDFDPIPPEELPDRIGEFHGFVVRSDTKITELVLAKSGKLKVLGRGGTGYDNLDLPAAKRKGIIVFTTPIANSPSAIEHTVAIMLSLARNIPQAYQSMKQGKWERNKFVGVELKDKDLGIIGMGTAGMGVAKIAAALEMNISAHDPFITQERKEYAEGLGVKFVSLDELVRQSDWITIHTTLTEKTRNLFNRNLLSMVKKGVRIINTARGEIFDEEALCDALDSGQVAGAAIDVFINEPKPNPRLIFHDSVLPTPHLGASTKEAQKRVATETAKTLKKLLDGELVPEAINIPRLSPEAMKEINPFLPVATSLAELAFLITDGRIKKVDIEYCGKIANFDSTFLRAAVVEGLLSPTSEERVNIVNFDIIAMEKGYVIREHKDPSENSYTSLMRIILSHEKGETVVEGITSHRGPQVMKINDYPVDFPLKEKKLLLVHNENRPGMTGLVTTMLGNFHINIGGMSLANNNLDDRCAMMAICLDSPLDEEQLGQIRDIWGIQSAQFIKLSTLA